MLDPSQLDFFSSQQVLRPSHKLSPNVDPDTDWSRWNCLYPHYVNSKKKISEGRRIPVSKAVEDPNVDEMGLICEHYQLPYVIEYSKAYPKDWLTLGRVRVLLKDESNDQPINKDIPSKKILMVKMGELIPQLKSRHSGSSSSNSLTVPSKTQLKRKKKH